MPRNLSAWIDVCIIIAAAFVLSAVLAIYNFFIGAMALFLCVLMLLFSRERCNKRSRDFDKYCENVVKNIKDVQNYATDNLPMMIIIIDQDYRLQWFNSLFAKKFPDMAPGKLQLEHFIDIKQLWPEISLPDDWTTEHEGSFFHNGHCYRLLARPIESRIGSFMAVYLFDATEHQVLKNAYSDSRTAICYIQIDCFDEVLQGISEAERNTVLFNVNQCITEWVAAYNGFIKKIDDDTYMAILDKAGVKRAIAEKFNLLDKVRSIPSTNRRQITLSLGIAVIDDESLEKLGEEADYMLTMALSRGGDQVAVHIDGTKAYYGARTQAVERTTRAKARSMSQNIHNMMSEASEIFIMGHANEDFDALGAAMGIVAMARQLKKPVYIVLSSNSSGIAPLLEYLHSEGSPYKDVFLSSDQLNFTLKNALLFVVDTQIKKMLPSESLLDSANELVIIDHHRRGEGYIDKKSVIYLETSMSSTCEMVTELITYFDDELKLDSFVATSLYAGIKVDTKNFTVNTGARTFDAASFLRRSGANPVRIGTIFASDYATDIAKAKAKAQAQLMDGGLVTTFVDNSFKNIQVIASQVADELLQNRDVHVSIVAYTAIDGAIGLSARSDGEINVQVIMEHFGGGGHQNVAGARVVGSTLQQVYEDVVNFSHEIMKENVS